MKNTFESLNIIEIYETKGRDPETLRGETPKMLIREHWNQKNLVVVEVGGVKYTVDAEQLKRAIQNAQNAHNF